MIEQHSREAFEKRRKVENKNDKSGNNRPRRPRKTKIEKDLKIDFKMW